MDSRSSFAEDFWDDGDPPAYAAKNSGRRKYTHRVFVDVEDQRIDKMSEDVVSDILDKAREIDEEAETPHSQKEYHFEQQAWEVNYYAQGYLYLLLTSLEKANKLKRYANRRIAEQISSEIRDD